MISPHNQPEYPENKSEENTPPTIGGNVAAIEEAKFRMQIYRDYKAGIVGVDALPLDMRPTEYEHER